MRCHNCMLIYKSVEKSREQWKALLKETLFIFALAFLLSVETIFGNYTRGGITSILPKNRSLSQIKGKMNLRCKVTSRRKVFILTHTKSTPLKFILLVFRKLLYVTKFKRDYFKSLSFLQEHFCPLRFAIITHIIITQKSNVFYYMF